MFGGEPKKNVCREEPNHDASIYAVDPPRSETTAPRSQRLPGWLGYTKPADGLKEKSGPYAGMGR